jgi:acetyltransferase-like isoleucine patch superfamily enzyme
MYGFGNNSYIMTNIKILFLPYYSSYSCFAKARMGISYLAFLKFKLFGSKYYWDKGKNTIVVHPRKIFIGKNSPVGRYGGYFQGAGEIYIGDYVQFGPNVSLISSNHDLYDQYKPEEGFPIVIDNYCWIGINSVILPGVSLGPRTIVGAGSVVTKSFSEGYCVVAGVPAKKIKDLDKEKFVVPKFENEFYGFLSVDEFLKYRNKFLDI